MKIGKRGIWSNAFDSRILSRDIVKLSNIKIITRYSEPTNGNYVKPVIQFLISCNVIVGGIMRTIAVIS